MRYNQSVNMIYMDDSGTITKRRIKPFKISGESFQAYCYLRGSKRTFKIDGVLALVPVTKREGMVV
jgi:predicted DNA-binding transcriptional regulator YafY